MRFQLFLQKFYQDCLSGRKSSLELYTLAITDALNDSSNWLDSDVLDDIDVQPSCSWPNSIQSNIMLPIDVDSMNFNALFNQSTIVFNNVSACFKAYCLKD